MTAQERPAGRMAGPARPAGADPRSAAARPTAIDPSIIRRALAASDTGRHADVAAEFGVATSTVTRWRARRDEAAARGQQWPSDADLKYWQARQPTRRLRRVTRMRWQLRRAAVGAPMLIDSTGTRRRLQALAALGWRYEDLAPLLGVVRSRVGHLGAGEHTRVHRDTAAAVAALYDRLSMAIGPSPRLRVLAANRGWASPLAWDDQAIDDPTARPRRAGDKSSAGPAFDEVAVARAMSGDRVHLRPVERTSVVRQLTARGLSAAQIAERLHTTKRSVARNRATDTTRRSA